MWCELAHRNAPVLGAKWGAVAQCARCGRQWRTPWAVAVQATPRGHLMPVWDHQYDGEKEGAHIRWSGATGVGAFVIAGVVVGVLMAGGLMGGLLGWLMGMGWGDGTYVHRGYKRKSLGGEWRRRVRNVLMLGLGGGGRGRGGGGNGNGERKHETQN